MNLQRFLGAVVMMCCASIPAWAAKPIPENSMGLNKESVFAVPAQQVYASKAATPGQNKVLPRAYLNAPPQVPHDIEDFLPITSESNLCVACHNQPGEWGKPRAQGSPTPIPLSHYTDMRSAPDKVGDRLVNARYNCNQCHVPQMDARPLVENTFGSKQKK